MRNHLFKEKILLRNLLPGLGISFLVALASKKIAVLFPSLGSATIAILLGILLGNTLLKQPILAKGTKIAESKLLEFSVVLLGTTVTFQTILQIGAKGFFFICLQMTLTILGAYFIGRKMNFSENMALLMAGGNAVCGSSAIASIAPAIQAKEEEKGQIITLVNLLGTLMMLTLPLIGTVLYGTDSLAKSALIGGTLQSVGQVVASGNILSPQIAELSMLFKIMRIILLVVVVFSFSRFKNRHPQTQMENTSQSTTRNKVLPWYVIGFILCCIFNSLFHFPKLLSDTTHFISSWFEITALAAIGLRLDFQKFFKEGKRFLIYGLSVGAVQITLAILLILLFKL
ncbi:YeiH family protein [Enterococcus sp. LJL99]